MKSHNRLDNRAILLIALFGMSITGTDAFAENITRSCSAHYFANISSVKFNLNGYERTLNVPYETINVSYQDQKFSAQGGCGKTVPNRCRKRARDKLVACAKAHAQSPNQRPQACQSDTVASYPIQNLISTIKSKACGKLTSKDGLQITDLLDKPYQVKVLLNVFVDGKDDCGYRKPGKTVVDGQRFAIRGNQFYLSEPLQSYTITCQ